jgi:hypothetical protein
MRLYNCCRERHERGPEKQKRNISEHNLIRLIREFSAFVRANRCKQNCAQRWPQYFGDNVGPNLVGVSGDGGLGRGRTLVGRERPRFYDGKDANEMIQTAVNHKKATWLTA